MPAAAHCSSCGQTNRDGARFCAVCGTALGGTAFFAPRRPPISAAPTASAESVPTSTPPASATLPTPALPIALPASTPLPPPTIPLTDDDAAAVAKLFSVGTVLQRRTATSPMAVAPLSTLTPAIRPTASPLPSVQAQAVAAAPVAGDTGRAAPFGGDPVLRETFYAAQRRHRRRARLLSAVTVVPVLLLAAFVAALISPWLFLLAAATLRLLRLAGPLHGLPQSSAQALYGLLLPLREYFDSKPVQTDAVVRLLLALLAPSVAILLLTWLWVKAVFRHASARGVLARMATRPPDSADPLEQRLLNINEEMAVAAGIRPPAVLLVDGDGVNAAILGSSYRDCTLVVSHALLQALSRDETEGVVAELVGSAGNGDLGLAAAILSVFQTIGLVLAARDVLLSGIARRTVWRFLRFSLWRGDSAKRAARAADVSDLLLRSTTVDGLDTAQTKPGETASLGKLGCITVWPFLATAMFRMFMMFYLSFITGPLLGWIWRTRRYLADATAVQLTRNPDALAGALQHLPLNSTRIAGGGSADHLFVVQPVRRGAFDPALAAFLLARRDEIMRQTAGQGWAARLSALRDLQIEAAAQFAATSAAGKAASTANTSSAADESVSDELGMHGLYPPTDKRLRRLQALGAHIDASAFTQRRPHRLIAYVLIGALLTPVCGLMLLAFGMIAAFAASANVLLAMPVLALVSWLAQGALG
jgi:Zn-dependent protease with chaperone function